jgi:hypothetical protein
MKLDVDLVRQLLLYVEEHAIRPISDLENIEIGGWTAEQIDYHVIQLFDAGFIEAGVDCIPDNEDPELVNVIYSVRRITYLGHNFLETIRDDSVWRKVKEKAKAVGTLSLPILSQLGVSVLKTALGLP